MCRHEANVRDRAKIKARRREWYLRNQESEQERARLYAASHPEVQLGTDLRRAGVTLLWYERTMKEQGGACAICAEPCRSGKRLAVDHHHDSGRIRGLLCQACNTALGLLREDPALFAKAVSYLLERADEPRVEGSMGRSPSA